MKNETQDRRWDLQWALPASLILHALIIALLVYGSKRPSQQPQQEQAVNVTLVPPPDQPKPKPAPSPSPKEAKAQKPPVQKLNNRLNEPFVKHGENCSSKLLQSCTVPGEVSLQRVPLDKVNFLTLREIACEFA